MEAAKSTEDKGFNHAKNVCETTTAGPMASSEERDSNNSVEKPRGVPSKFLGVPLVDFDHPGDETFVVIARRFGKQIVYRFSKENSLYLFSPTSSIRQLTISITTNQYFELSTLLLILSNCVILALNNPPEEIEYVFAALYTLEMVLKIVAKGFCLHKFAYLRDRWNWMDFVVVILGYVTLAPSVANLSGIRTFRVLRALRTISVVEGLKTMVNAFLRSMRMLTDVLILAIFFISMFALIGMQLFVGILRNKCVLTPGSNFTGDFDKFLANESNWLYVDGDPVVCGNSSTARACPMNYTCFPDVGDNPNYGYTNFDSFPWAVMCTIQLVTGDYWENLYEYIITAGGFSYVLYFMMVIFFGSFYLLNLVLAVVALSYQQELVNLKSQAAGFDQARRSSSSYSLRVTPEPQLLFGARTESLSNWSNVIRRLTNKASYDDRSSVPSDTYVPSSTDSKRFSVTCSIIIERPEPIPSDEVICLARNGNGNDFMMENRDTLNQNGGTLMNRTASENPSKTSCHENVGRENIGLSCENRLSVDTGLMVVKTSSLCVVIPSDRSIHGHLSVRNMFRRKCARVITNPMFDWFITGVIFLNTVFMAVEHHGMNKQLEKTVDVMNLVCTCVFLLEMLVKIIALSPRGYIRSRWNLLDGFIVVMSMVDMGTVLLLPSDKHHGAGFSVLRSLRLIRVFKLAQSWVTMRTLLAIIGDSIGALGNLTLLLAIVIYTFAVIGMQLFSESFKKAHENEEPRWHFSDFLHSFMIIFRVLCGEWIETLYLTMHVTSPAAILFYFAVLGFGNFLILNLFLALLLSSFEAESLNAVSGYSKKVQGKFRNLVRKLMNVLSAFRTTSVSSETSESTEQNACQEITQETTGLSGRNEAPKQEKCDKQGIEDGALSSISQGTEEKEGTANKNNTEDEPHEKYKISKSSDDKERKAISCTQPKNGERHRQWLTSTGQSQGALQHDAPVVPECFPSFCCSGFHLRYANQSPVCRFFTNCRAKVLAIVKHKYFDGFILFVIIVSSVSMVFEDVHLNSRPTLKSILDVLNIVVTGIFTLEFILKVFALGFVKYFHNAWNCLDCFIVVVSVIGLVNSFAGSSNSLTSFRSMRTFRALRPLRAIPRWQGMKVVVNSLLYAIPEIGNVSLVCMVFWLIFSIIGVQAFGGRFFKCVDENGETLSDSLVRNKTECLALNYKWKNSKINFDNSLSGFLALFQVATFEGWIEVMADAADVTKVDQQPRRDSNHISHLYFVAFVLIGSFFVLNLFVGVIIENFNRLKKQYDGNSAVALFLTESQRAWYDTLKKAASKKPRKVVQKPKKKWRATLFNLVNSSKFELVIMLLIMANMVVMMVKHHRQSEAVTDTLFTIIFFLEAVLRVSVLRWDYFKEPWNDFDLLVVVLSIVGIIVEFLDRTFIVNPSTFRVVRVLRVGRLLRFYTNARGIRRLLFALLISLPALVNIGALLFLTLFIYAIIGMSSFAHVKRSGALNDIVNFETFGNSILLLFRVSTSAGWNDVLDAVMIEPPDCDPTYDDLPNGNCGNPRFAILYFVSFILFSWLIIVNMYIAIILENLHEAFQAEATGITEDDIDMFYGKWEHFDPQASQYIPHDQLSDFVDTLEEPLRIAKPNKFACIHLDIPIKQGDRIHCVDVLQALVRHTLGDIEQENPEAFFMVQKTLEESFRAAFPTRAKQNTETTTFVRNREIRAAIAIQKAWRARDLKARSS